MYWKACQLCRFRYKPTYVLHNFCDVIADRYFSWLCLNFHWLSFCGDFYRCIFSLLKQKKTAGKKTTKNVPPNWDKSIGPYSFSRENGIYVTAIIQKNRIIPINSYLPEIFPCMLFLEDILGHFPGNFFWGFSLML